MEPSTWNWLTDKRHEPDEFKMLQHSKNKLKISFKKINKFEKID